MEAKSVTRDEFDAIKQSGNRPGRSRSPEVQRALDLSVGKGCRFKDHVHKATGKHKPSVCRLQANIAAVAQYAGMKVSMKHDGPDLVVFRTA